MNFLISFFAEYNDLHDFMIRGDLFQSLVSSFWNVHSAMFENPFSTRSPFAEALDVLIAWSAFCLKWFIEELQLFRAFQVSVNFISAFNWFTENELKWPNSDFVVTRSLRLLLFRKRIILFWVFCNSFIIAHVVSTEFILTLAHNCNLYIWWKTMFVGKLWV